MTAQSTNELKSEQISTESSAGGGHAGLRVYWMGLGNVALLITAGLISKEPRWTLGALDAGYAFIVVTLIAARYVDIKCYGGETAYGDAASTRNLFEYCVGLVVLAASVWGLVQSIDY